MSLKNISIILCFIVFVNHMQASEPQAKPDVQPGNNESDTPPVADARIRLISAYENKERKSYRWALTRSSPLQVVQGWYSFDEVGIREHGGGGQRIAEAKPMQLSLLISKEDDYLALKRSYAFSGDLFDQQADVIDRTQWLESAELKTYYLPGYAGLTDRLQPLWKGDFIRDEKVVKTVVYAARVVGPDVPNNLFGVNDTSEPLRIGRKWRPVSKEWEKPTPKAWIQQYLGVEFPNSARHFVLYYRASDEDIILFSFDIAKDDLQHLMDGRGIFPTYGDLVSGRSDFPERIVHDWGSQYFAQRIAAMQDALSANKSRTVAAEPLTVQLWIAESSTGIWTVYVCVIGDQRAEAAIAYGGFKTPVEPVETHSYVIMDSRYEQMADTNVWQRWSLDETAYRQLMQTLKARNDILRFSGEAAERRVGGFARLGPGSGAPWWKPSELKQTHPGDSEPLEYFSDRGPGVTSSLVIGRKGGLFHCYVRTERHVLASDPLERIWRSLGLELPDSASDAHYESASYLAGIVLWMRFDLPRRDFEACLDRTPKLPAYARFTADAVLKEYLYSGYRTGAPEWWRPWDLSEGIYALRRTNTKELSDIAVGIGHLKGENIRVYIGAFSPW